MIGMWRFTKAGPYPMISEGGSVALEFLSVQTKGKVFIGQDVLRLMVVFQIVQVLHLCGQYGNGGGVINLVVHGAAVGMVLQVGQEQRMTIAITCGEKPSQVQRRLTVLSVDVECPFTLHSSSHSPYAST